MVDVVELEERLTRLESGRLPADYGLPRPPAPSPLSMEIAEQQEQARQRRAAQLAAAEKAAAWEAARALEEQHELWRANTPAREAAESELDEVEGELGQLRQRGLALRARRRELLEVINVGVAPPTGSAT